MGSILLKMNPRLPKYYKWEMQSQAVPDSMLRGQDFMSEIVFVGVTKMTRNIKKRQVLYGFPQFWEHLGAPGGARPAGQIIKYMTAGNILLAALAYCEECRASLM